MYLVKFLFTTRASLLRWLKHCCKDCLCIVLECMLPSCLRSVIAHPSLDPLWNRKSRCSRVHVKFSVLFSDAS
ncbi:hypothetical protein BDZ94DRAFT_1268673 [Collybia nuda]|uniref:Uncharacterized protein n=1 Tax=Collybia nuda TaxID=64659 RepID=A0A9P6CB99_9AGAR|nr:hypothetical protein BDZ94DRAFT_1268673 [Collybia nuda]